MVKVEILFEMETKQPMSMGTIESFVEKRKVFLRTNDTMNEWLICEKKKAMILENSLLIFLPVDV